MTIRMSGEQPAQGVAQQGRRREAAPEALLGTPDTSTR
jgi:hypothetical protein